jgi:hypothetical protein
VADNKSGIDISPLYGRSIGYPDYSTTQTITVAAASAAIATALKGNATFLMTADTDCHVRFATTPVAVTTDHPIFAGADWLVHVPKGSTLKVAAIQKSAGGTLWITELVPDRLG